MEKPRSNPRSLIRCGPPRPLNRKDDTVVWARPSPEWYAAANVRIEPLYPRSKTVVSVPSSPVVALDAPPAAGVVVKAEPIDVDATAPYLDVASLVAQHIPSAFDVAQLDRVRPCAGGLG